MCLDYRADVSEQLTGLVLPVGVSGVLLTVLIKPVLNLTDKMLLISACKHIIYTSRHCLQVNKSVLVVS